MMLVVCREKIESAGCFAVSRLGCKKNDGQKINQFAGGGGGGGGGGGTAAPAV